MDNVIYLEYNIVGTPPRNSEKPAKISQEKLAKMRLRTSEIRKTFKKAPVVVPAAAQPIAEKPTEKPVVARVVVNNYDEVINTFGMHVYKNGTCESPLVAARKVRTAQRILHPLRDFSSKKAIDVIDLTPKKVAAPEIKVEPPVAPVVEQPKVEMTNKEVVIEKPIEKPVVSAPAPSVDDYLQKEQKEVHQDNVAVEILQLEGDVNSLKDAAIKKHEELKALEAKYKEIQDKKMARIKELEEEKLSYTTTLNGLTEKIAELQKAIAEEESALSQSKAA